MPITLPVLFALWSPFLSAAIRRRAAQDTCGSFSRGSFQERVLFQTLTDPRYVCFRIPALLHVPKHPEGKHPGALLAFAEGRRGTLTFSDSGSIDLVLRRSLDGGETFGPLRVIASGPDVGIPQGATVGNPAPVFVSKGHVVVLLLSVNLATDDEKAITARTSKGSRDVFIMRSWDAGETWSKPERITASVKWPSWTWYATGPGGGIELQSGRLVVPCDHAGLQPDGSVAYASHIIISDDSGETWRIGTSGPPHSNECTVAETSSGALLLNMRDLRGTGQRMQQRSQDAGATWSAAVAVPELVEPTWMGCEAHLLAVNRSAPGGLREGLYFSNPAGPKRNTLTVRWSGDSGASWTGGTVVYGGPAAYSSLQPLGPSGAPTHLGVLYESGELFPYQRITLAKIPAICFAEPKWEQ